MSFHGFRQLSLETEGPLRLVVVGAGGMGRAWMRNITASPDAAKSTATSCSMGVTHE